MIQDSKAPGGSLTSQGMWFLYLLLCKCPTSAWEFRRFVGFLWWWYKGKTPKDKYTIHLFWNDIPENNGFALQCCSDCWSAGKNTWGGHGCIHSAAIQNPFKPCWVFFNLMTTENHWNFGLLRMNSHLASNRLNIQIVIMTCFTAAWPFSHRGSLNSTILHMALRLVGCTLWWTVASLTRFYEKYTAIALFFRGSDTQLPLVLVHNMLS